MIKNIFAYSFLIGFFSFPIGVALYFNGNNAVANGFLWLSYAVICATVPVLLWEIFEKGFD